MILTLVIGVAIGALGYHFFAQSQLGARPTVGPKVSHSTSDPERTAMETVFACRYARFHKAKDLESLLAMGKYDGVWEDILSSRKANLGRSFAQEITGFSFRELSAEDKLKAGEKMGDLSDLSLEPLLQYTVSFAQPNPELDRIQAFIGFLGVQAGQLNMADRVKK